MKRFYEKGKPTIWQCLPSEGGCLAVKLARKKLRAINKGRDTGTVYVTGNAVLPGDIEMTIGRLNLPVEGFHAADKVSRRTFINSLTADDRVIVLFDSEDEFMRKGYYDHSSEHKLMWQIRNGHFGWKRNSKTE